MSRYRVYLDPVPNPPLVDPNPKCSRHDLHTPCPEGYIEAQEWWAEMKKLGKRQSACPGCGMWFIWS